MSVSKEAYQHIRSIQIKATRNVNDLFAGIYRSVFKGRGLEFEEVREYQPGDEIRTIDWNVTAKLQNPFVKSFREERELTVMLVVDVSASSRFGHASRLKSEMIAEIAALLAFSAIKNQDKVGLLLFSDRVELYLSPKKGTRHVLRLIRELLFYKPQGTGTNLKEALNFLGKVQRHKTICFLLSDFLAPDFEHALVLNAKRHECIGIHVFDDYEKEFPDLGLVRMHDLETNQKRVVDTSDPNLREHFHKNTEKTRGDLRQLFNRAGAELISLKTSDSVVKTMQRFFKQRSRTR